MHLLDALSVVDNSNSEGFHNIIVNLFTVVLEYTPRFLLHALSQLEPSMLLKIDVLVHVQISTNVIVKPVLLSLAPWLHP